MNSYESCSFEEDDNQPEDKQEDAQPSTELLREAKHALTQDRKHQKSRRNFSVNGSKAALQSERENGAYTAYVATLESMLSSLLGRKTLLMRNTRLAPS